MLQTTGKCLCGAITYRANIDETRIVICHCTDCQVTGGGAFRLVTPMQPEHLELTQGAPRTYDKVAESGRIRRQAFCGDCGTSLYSAPPDGETGFVSLRVNTCAHRDQLQPIAELWCDSRATWLGTIEGAAVQFDKQPSLPE